jgi:hypothetical protein
MQVLADPWTEQCRHFKACRHLALDLLTTQQVHLCSPTPLCTSHRPRSGVLVLEIAVLAWSMGSNEKRVHPDRTRLPHGLLHCSSKLTRSIFCSKTARTRACRVPSNRHRQPSMAVLKTWPTSPATTRSYGSIPHCRRPGQTQIRVQARVR